MRCGTLQGSIASDAAPVSVGLPDLRVVASGALRLHEDSDPERVALLAQRLSADGVLRNPPIVAPLDAMPGPTREYVVLDGANRVTAMLRAGLPHQVVQVIAYDDPSVLLDVWAHLLQRDGEIVRLFRAWTEASPADVSVGLNEGTLACGLVTARGAWGARIAGTLGDRVNALAAIVGTYKGKVPIYRVQSADFDALAKEFGGADALVLFPRLSKADIRAIARLPVKLPTGISRHVVPLRALRIDVDLDMLKGNEPIAAKQTRLDAEIRARLLDRRVRHYPEATVLYDE